MLNAGRRIKFAPTKTPRFSELFFGILLSEFRFAVFIPGAIKRIHTSPTIGDHFWSSFWFSNKQHYLSLPPIAICSQPAFFTNIWTALFGIEIWKEKPPRLRSSKMPKILKDKSAEMSCVHFTRLLGLLWHYLKKILRIRILRRVRRLDKFFLWSNLILRPV